MSQLCPSQIDPAANLITDPELRELAGVSIKFHCAEKECTRNFLIKNSTDAYSPRFVST